MKRRIEWGLVVCAVCFIFVVRFGLLEGPGQHVSVDLFSRSSSSNVSAYWTLQPNFSKISGRTLDEKLSLLPSSANVSLGAWGGLKRILERSDIAEDIKDSFREGLEAWKRLLQLLDDEGRRIPEGRKDNEDCPQSIEFTNSTQTAAENIMHLPCGLILDSSITILATPLSGSNEFQIELVGASAIGQYERELVNFHYKVRLKGDELTDQSVIVQNAWTSTDMWQEEERCPSPVELFPSQVDGFDRCNNQVGKVFSWKPAAARESGTSKWTSITSPSKPWFPFAEGMPFAATILAGWEGFHVTVNGRHISSFPYRQGHDPWLVGKIGVRGDVHLSSIIAAGLPTLENLAALRSVESLKALPLPPKSKKLALFIGILSSGNNFDRRMAQRKAWMQYEAVRSGEVGVRFFVGLHNQEHVNKVLWEEAKTFGDIQLLPFVDYYSLITLKTAAICIFATEHLQADYVMKTDDDTFVRVDEILFLLPNKTSGESYILGEIERDSLPDRDSTAKWYITPEEWPHTKYPPWAHGPGYIFSSDIAKFVSRVSNSSQLRLFKLEDVAMGIWMEDFQRIENQTVQYVDNGRFHSAGCKEDYVIAHYQNPRQMLCLWDRLQSSQRAECCEE